MIEEGWKGSQAAKSAAKEDPQGKRGKTGEGWTGRQGQEVPGNKIVPARGGK